MTYASEYYSPNSSSGEVSSFSPGAITQLRNELFQSGEPGTDVNIVSVAGQPVNGLGDFKSSNVFRVSSPISPGASITKATYTIPEHLRGDTWGGLANSEVVDFEDNPVDLTGATIRMEVRTSTVGDVVIAFTTADQTIEISDAIAGLFTIPKRVIDIPPRNYVYDIQVELANGDVHTVLFGTWKIAQDVTR